MKNTLQSGYQTPLPVKEINPPQPAKQKSPFGFYLLMGTLALGLLYFVGAVIMLSF